jgi:hypothetical protein
MKLRSFWCENEEAWLRSGRDTSISRCDADALKLDHQRGWVGGESGSVERANERVDDKL